MMSNLGKLFTLLLLVLLGNPVMADVSAHLNQNTFYEGDQITLNIESTMNTKAQPDLSVLEKNFRVLGTSTSSQINILNGKRSFKKMWIIELQPKQKGAIQIPAINIGNEKTQPLNIKIATLPPEIKAETSKHVFIETSVGISGNETYVQQQIPYTVKLYFDSAMQSGEISQPSVNNAVVEELIDGKRYEVMRAGKKFTVIEKHFTISPEKNGKLHIPATIVNGRIALSGGDSARMDETDMLNNFFSNFRNDPFFNDPFFKDSFGEDFFSRRSVGSSKPFSIKSQTIDINVLPVPKSFTGSAWLPAEELSIRDSWTRSPPALKVGEPVTRTLVLRAKGLGGSQIPTIDISKPNDIKIYPEQPTSKTHTDGITLIGRQYFDISYIPQKAGKITIPEIKVDWWNIKTKKQETVTLPAWQLNVAPGILSNTEAEEPLAIKDEEKPKMAKPETVSETEIENASTIISNSWIWKIAALMAILFLALATLFYMISSYRKRSLQHVKKPYVNINALKTIALQACQENDKQAAAKAILKLAQAQWGDHSIQNLGALMLSLGKQSGNSAASVAVIKELEESLYSSSSHQWNGANLKAVIKAGLQPEKVAPVTKTGALEPLYPV